MCTGEFLGRNQRPSKTEEFIQDRRIEGTMSEEMSEKIYIKVPTFDGNKSKWLIFKAKMESYLAQKDFITLLNYAGDIPKDSGI